jgi:hypothetical protein
MIENYNSTYKKVEKNIINGVDENEKITTDMLIIVKGVLI